MINKKGFTLIELLVVVSIIAMLSSVVLAGLRSARVKAFNTRIVQETQQLKNHIEIGRNPLGVYPSLMGSAVSGSYVLARQQELAANPIFMPLINDILSKNGSSWPGGYGGANDGSATGCRESYTLAANDPANKLTIFVNTTACVLNVSSPATGYAIYAAFTPVNSGYYCTDSTGGTKSVTTGYIPNAPTVPTTCQ